jgi:hypothetical protein
MVSGSCLLQTFCKLFSPFLEFLLDKASLIITAQNAAEEVEMKDFFENIFAHVMEFFEPDPKSANSGSGSVVVPFSFLTAFAILSATLIYEMYCFAYSGKYGAVGMGIVLFLAWLMVIVAFVLKMRLRSFLINALVVSAVFIYFVPININYSREHGDTTLQETIRATGQNTD